MFLFQTSANYCCANSPHNGLANTSAWYGPQTLTMGGHGGPPWTGGQREGSPVLPNPAGVLSLGIIEVLDETILCCPDCYRTSQAVTTDIPLGDKHLPQPKDIYEVIIGSYDGRAESLASEEQ